MNRSGFATAAICLLLAASVGQPAYAATTTAPLLPGWGELDPALRKFIEGIVATRLSSNAIAFAENVSRIDPSLPTDIVDWIPLAYETLRQNAADAPPTSGDETRVLIIESMVELLKEKRLLPADAWTGNVMGTAWSEWLHGIITTALPSPQAEAYANYLSATPRPTSQFETQATCLAPNDGGLLGLILLLVSLACPVLLVVHWVVGLTVGVILLVLGPVLAPVLATAFRVFDLYRPAQPDIDLNGFGDEYEYPYVVSNNILSVGGDLDLDSLTDLTEFRWNYVAFCIPFVFNNCQDTDRDGWGDYAEQTYWNNPQNDPNVVTTALALQDPDRSVDTDGDGTPNAYDLDSDQDGLTDGAEGAVRGSYPEFVDSDCSSSPCTPVTSTNFYATDRQGSPGTGDGINDTAETAKWDAISSSAWTTNYDGDAYPNNLMDPDADGDALQDGSEFLCQTLNAHDLSQPACTHANEADSDQDGLLDGSNVTVDATDPRYNLFEQLGIVYVVAEGGREYLGEFGQRTDPLDADTDNDGQTDGAEANGEHPTKTVARADPTNQDLPQDQMHPTNLNYLRTKQTDAEQQSEETVQVVDELISAAIAGNVSQALNVIYDVVPVEPPLRNAESLVQLTHEAALALVRCGNPVRDAVTSAAPTTALDEVARCVTTTVLPFLGAVLERTVRTLPIVGDIVEQVEDEELPFIVETADRILPIDVETTTQDLLENPIAATTELVVGLPAMLTDPQTVDETIAGLYATQDILVATLVKPTNRHPQLLYDLAAGQGLEASWESWAAANEAASSNSDGNVDGTATIDSLSFNLYTVRNGVERITAVLAADRDHCVQLDASTATRDANGCDLYASLTASPGAITSLGPPTVGNRPTPALRIRAALSAATFDLQAIGYLQIPGVPYLVAMGYDSGAQGLPQDWQATLAGWDTGETDTRSLSFTTEHAEEPGGFPLDVLFAAFKVDENQRNKPVVGSNETILEVTGTLLPQRLSLRLQDGANRVEFFAETSAETNLDFIYKDAIGNKQSLASLYLQTLPVGPTTITSLFKDGGGVDLMWQQAGSAPTQVDMAYLHTVAGEPIRVLDVSGRGLGTAFTIQSDATLHRHMFNALAPITEIHFLVAQNADSCQVGNVVGDYMAFRRTAASYCAAGFLTGATSLTIEANGASATAQGSRGSDSSTSTTIVASDGHKAIFSTQGSPQEWKAVLAHGSASEDLTWAATSGVQAMRFEVEMDGPDGLYQAKAALTDVPDTVAARFERSSGRGQLTGTDYVGSAALLFTSTGNAPNRNAVIGGDHARIRLVPGTAGNEVESAWKVSSVRDLVVESLPDGTLRVQGDFQAPRPLTVQYQDDQYDLLLESTAAVGLFEYRLHQDTAQSMVEYHQDAGTVAASLHLVAGLPQGRFALDLSNAPAQVDLLAHLSNGTIDLDMSGTATSIDARYAANMLYPTIASTNGFLVMNGEPDSPRLGFHLKRSSVQALTFQHLAGALELRGTASTSPFIAQAEDATENLRMELNNVPATSSARLAPSNFLWSSSGTGALAAFKSAAPSGRSFSLTTSGVPTQLDIRWPTSYASVFDATITHNGNSLGNLNLQETLLPAESSAMEGGLAITGVVLPAQTQIRIDTARGIASVTARNGANQPSPAGDLRLSFANQRNAFITLAGATQGVKLLQQEQISSGALSFKGLRQLDVSLLTDGGTTDGSRRISIDRTTTGSFVLRAGSTAEEASAMVSVGAGAPQLTLSAARVSQAGPGVRIVGSGSQAYGAVSAKFNGPGPDIGFATSGTPQTFEVTWSPASSFHVAASSAFTPAIQLADSLARAPWSNILTDFLVMHGESADDAASQLGARLSNIRAFDFDAARGTFHAEGTGTATPFGVDYGDGTLGVRLSSSSMPASWDLAWDPKLRTFRQTGALASLGWSQYAVDSASPRIAVALEGVPAGDVVLAAGATGSFSLTAPAPLGRVRVAADQGGTGPLPLLAQNGVFIDETAPGRPFRLNLPNVQKAEATWASSGAVSLEVVGASSSPLQVRLVGAGVLATATADTRPGATSVLQWPSPSNAQSMIWSASGLGGHVLMGLVAGEDSGRVEFASVPSSWTWRLEREGPLHYTAAESTLGITNMSGSWRGVAVDAELDRPASEVHVVPAASFLTGAVTTVGGSVARLRATIAPSGGSSIPVVDWAGDGFLVDASQHVGMASMNLAGLQDASWTLPAVQGTIRFVSHQASTASSTLLQFMHPSFQTRYVLPQGVPASLTLTLVTGAASATFTGESGKTVTVQHQNTHGNTFRATVTAPPATFTMKVEPRALIPFDYTGSLAAAGIDVEALWQGGMVKVAVTSVPTRLRLTTAGAIPSTGTVSTLGSGPVGTLQLLAVPAGTEVNRYDAPTRYLAVDAQSSTPYVALDLENLATASWQVPASTQGQPMTVTINRTLASAQAINVVLSGAREDLTAIASSAGSAMKLEAQRTVGAGGTGVGSTLNVTYTSTGGTTGRLDLTHLNAETGQSASAFLEGATGTTWISAKGTQPSLVTVTTSQPLARVGLGMADEGTAIRLDARSVPSRLEVFVDRGTCDVTTPFKGYVSTLGTSVTGPVLALIGDEGLVPNIPAGKQVLDARCDDARAHVGFQMPRVQHAAWDTSAASHRFDGSRENTEYYLSWAEGFLRAVGSFESLDQGQVVFTVGGASKVSLAAAGRLARWNLQVDGSTSMEFRGSPVDWYIVNATGVPKDLFMDINPKPNELGEFFPTLELKSASGDALGSYKLGAQLEKRPFEQFHRAQVIAPMRIGSLDAYIGSGEPRLLRNEGIKDGFQFVWNGDINWHIQFHDLLRFRGSADRQCHTMSYNVEYERSSGPSRPMADHLDLGEACDENRFEVPALPSIFRYELKWSSLLDMQLTVTAASQPISRLDLWADSVCAGSSCAATDPEIAFEVRLTNIPAGSTEIRSFVSSAAGILKMNAVNGQIGSAHLGLTFGDPNRYLSVHLNNVKAELEWDLDGDQRFQGVPAFVFADTENTIFGGAIRSRSGNLGWGFGGFALANEFQIKLDPHIPTSFNLADALFKVAGYGCANGRMDVLVRDIWIVVPSPLLACKFGEL